MKCSIRGCPGEYEQRFIVHTLHRGTEVFVFEHVPADVCTACGDTLLAPATIEHIEKALETKRKPERLVPLYEYA